MFDKNFIGSTQSEAHLVVDNISVEYVQYKVINNVTFTLQQGEIGCLLGPSGCGKTTLLRAIAGFERIISGVIELGSEALSNTQKSTPPEQRNIGMVFQDYALFPHLSVLKNVAFGLYKMSKPSANKKAGELLEKVGLSGKENVMPHELSGGEQQRVALARALAPKPKLLLLDEPFSNLDVELRESLSRDVREVIKDLGTTALMVTHDQHEAFAMADSIGVMQKGALEQWGSAYSIYHQPANPFVANFVGKGVLLEGVMQTQKSVATALGVLDYHNNAEEENQLTQDQFVRVLIRPDDIIHEDTSKLTAKVVSRHFRGAEFLYTLMLDNGEKVFALVPSHHDHAINESIGIRLEIDHVVIFQEEK